MPPFTISLCLLSFICDLCLFSIVTGTQISILALMAFHPVVSDWWYPHPDVLFLIWLPSDCGLTQCYQKVTSYCCSFKITPSNASKNSENLWGLHLGSGYSLALLTPLCKADIFHGTVCSCCTISLCHLLCPAVFLAMPKSFHSVCSFS